MSESAKILITLPSGEVRKYGLEMESIRIGRAADNTVVIEDPSLSAHHCVLRRVGAGSNFSLEDLESTNGLEVNGEETTMAELSHADVVKIGEIMMLFMQAGRPALDPLPPYVKKEVTAKDAPADDDDGENSAVNEDSPNEEDSEDKNDNDGEEKKDKSDAQKPVSPSTSKKQPSQQDYVQVEESGGCGSAIFSLLILLLAPVVGLCVHHFLATGRFLLLDLVSGPGQ